MIIGLGLIILASIVWLSAMFLWTIEHKIRKNRREARARRNHEVYTKAKAELARIRRRYETMRELRR